MKDAIVVSFEGEVLGIAYTKEEVAAILQATKHLGVRKVETYGEYTARMGAN